MLALRSQKQPKYLDAISKPSVTPTTAKALGAADGQRQPSLEGLHRFLTALIPDLACPPLLVACRFAITVSNSPCIELARAAEDMRRANHSRYGDDDRRAPRLCLHFKAFRSLASLTPAFSNRRVPVHLMFICRRDRGDPYWPGSGRRESGLPPKTPGFGAL